MHREQSFQLPALIPLLSCVAGLAASRIVIHPALAAAGVSAVAIFILSLRSPRRIRAALALLLASLGIVLGAQQRTRDAELRATIAAVNPDRFVEIEAPVADWRRSAYGGWTMRTARFAIVAGTRRIDLDAPLSLFVGSPPSDASQSSTIHAEGFLRLSEDGRAMLTIKSERLIEYSGRPARWSPARWNREMARCLDSLASADASLARPVALAEALALGRSDQLPEDIRDSYRRGGTYHLLVFSGMQIAAAAAFLALMLRVFATPRAIDFALLVLSIGAPFFAGNEPSVTRSSWMIGLYALSRILHRPTRIENLVFVAALIRLITVPAELTDAGFALTYAATGGLILVGKPLARAMARLRLSVLAYGIGAELATTPLTLLFFHQLVIGGAIVTIILSPLFSVMFGGSVAAAVAAPFLPLASDFFLRCVGSVDGIAEAINGFFGVTLRLARMAPAPPLWTVVAAFLMLLFALAWRPNGRVARAAPTALLVPVGVSLFLMLTLHSVQTPRLEMLDVGEGDSILLRNGHEAMLVDGGGRAVDSRFGRSVLIPMLLDRGVTRLDAVAMSHPHPDHCGGLLAIVENLDVGELWIAPGHVADPCAQELLVRAHAAAIPIRLVHDGESIDAIGLHFETFLANRRFKRASVNNSSLLLRVHMGERAALLTGDAENEAEMALVGEAARPLHADILKVAHHGGANSTSEALLVAVAPRIALISVGRRNLFGHPSEAVLMRLGRAGVRILRTDRDGAITVNIANGCLMTQREIDTSH